MAACDIDALKAQAVANRFDQLNPRQLWAAILQELSAWTANALTPAQLLSQACENGFACVVGRLPLAAAMQLVCNLGDGLLPECVNIIPEGATYDASNAYRLFGLTDGANYKIIWGSNEQGIDWGAGSALSPGEGTVTFFTMAFATAVDITGIGPNIPLTATICEV